jgi:hypothetical protein
MSSLKRLTFTSPRPTICLSLISSLRHVDDFIATDPHRDEHLDATMTPDMTPTRRANMHTLDSSAHTLPNDDLDETPATVPRNHPPIYNHPPPPCRWQHPVATSSVSLCHATITHPEALVWGQAQLQILNLARIPIVAIRPPIDHMKLDKHADTQKFGQGCVSHPLIYPLYFFLFSWCYKTQTFCTYIKNQGLATT